MTDALIAVLPVAFGALFASVPVIAMAAVLATLNTRAVLCSFTAGFAVGVLAVAAVGLAIVDGVSAASDSAAWVSWLRIALAVVLLALAVRKFATHVRTRDSASEPGWMANMRRTTAGRAFLVAFLLGSVNPKNAAIVLSGVSAVVAATTVVADQIVPVLVFVVIASLGVAVPLLAVATLGARATTPLESFVGWFAHNSNIVMGVVLVALAFMVGSYGIAALS